jgi:hypothetical protein
LSILLFENYLIPVLQRLTYFIFSKLLNIFNLILIYKFYCMFTYFRSKCVFINSTLIETISGSETTQSLMWKWMVPALSYIFRAFWVIPLFWITKPLNSLWYQVCTCRRCITASTCNGYCCLYCLTLFMLCYIQEIADLAYRKRSGKPTVLLSSSGR